jgi:2-polyprenyl-3-methyl-5-hydroxy-6-metoxy-1,4-benzoquinol methylase
MIRSNLFAVLRRLNLLLKSRNSELLAGNGLEQTASYWGVEAGAWQIGRGLNWTEHIAVQERINSKVSGDPHKNPYQFFMDFLVSEGIELPLSQCLTLGCGAGDLERGLSPCNFCQRHDAYDIASEAIRRAREQAKEQNLTHIHYETADINKISLTPERYDVVFGIASIHHIAALEHVFSEVKKTLKPGGYFFLNEFVGPTKFQWTDKQVGIVNALLQLLPERYRISVKDRATVISNFRRPTIVEMDSVDPSEAVRSAEILTLLPRYFAIKKKIDLGGTILHFLLQDIAGNFDYNKSEDARMLEMLFQVEDAFLEIGEISSDFAVIIAQKL